MKTRLRSRRYSGTRAGRMISPTSSAAYQFRWNPSRKRTRSCAYAVLKTKRMAARSDLLSPARAEHALRRDGEHHQQHHVGRHVLEALRQVGAGEQLDEPDDEPAGERAGNGAEAAPDGRREGPGADEGRRRDEL